MHYLYACFTSWSCLRFLPVKRQFLLPLLPVRESHSVKPLEIILVTMEAMGIQLKGNEADTMVLSWKRVECPMQIGDEILPQLEELKYLGILITSEGRWESGIIGRATPPRGEEPEELVSDAPWRPTQRGFLGVKTPVFGLTV